MSISDKAYIKQLECFSIGEHSRVREFTSITPKCNIGNHCGISRNVTIAGSNYTFTMKDFSSIAPGARIFLQSNDYVRDLLSHDSSIEGDVTLERFSGVGANSVVMPNNHIPEGTVIGALSFVPENFKFKEWTVYAGSPIREIRPRDKASVMAQYEEAIKK